MTETMDFGDSTVIYRDNSSRMIEFHVWDDGPSTQTLLLDLEEVLKLKYFIEDSLKDFCND